MQNEPDATTSDAKQRLIGSINQLQADQTNGSSSVKESNDATPMHQFDLTTTTIANTTRRDYRRPAVLSLHDSGQWQEKSESSPNAKSARSDSRTSDKSFRSIAGGGGETGDTNGDAMQDDDCESLQIKHKSATWRLLNKATRGLIGNGENHRTWSVVILLGLLNVAMVMLGAHLERSVRVNQAGQQRLRLFEDDRMLHLLDQSVTHPLLQVEYGVNIPKDLRPIKCSQLGRDGRRSFLCRDWPYRASLSVTVERRPTAATCYHVQWRSHSSHEQLRDCIRLDEHSTWFGMGHVRNNPWSLNRWRQPLAPFVTSDRPNERTPFGSIIRRYWLSSSGAALSVPLDIPLYVSFNQTDINGVPSNQLCLEAALGRYPYFGSRADFDNQLASNLNDYDAPSSGEPSSSSSEPLSSSSSDDVRLEYTICTGSDLKHVHSEFSRNWTHASDDFDVDKSSEMQLLSQPIWSTEQWPTLDENQLQRFARSVQSLQPNVSGLLLLDSRWERCLGELQEHKTRFARLNETLQSLANRGLTPMLTISPLLDIGARQLLPQATLERRIVQDERLHVPLLTRCLDEQQEQQQLEQQPQRFCALLDLVRLNNGEWLQKRLRPLLDRLQVRALMLAGVPVSRTPVGRQVSSDSSARPVNPDYAQVRLMDIGSASVPLVGSSTSAGVSNFAGFVRIPTLPHSWPALQSLIPTVLSLGIVGFALVNSGSVGGHFSPDARDDELLIRWAQLAQFMPIVQYGRPDAISNLDIGHLKAIKKFEHVRRNDLLPAMRSALVEHRLHGWPIIRPLWWLDPGEPDFLTVQDQFAIGDDIVVAPVCGKAQTKRDILLPRGQWQDMITLGTLEGGKKLHDYRVELHQVAYFRRIQPEHLQSASLSSSSSSSSSIGAILSVNNQPAIKSNVGVPII